MLQPGQQLSFNTSLKVDSQESRVTSDGGLILPRELDERPGFGEFIEQYLTGSRAKHAREHHTAQRERVLRTNAPGCGAQGPALSLPSSNGFSGRKTPGTSGREGRFDS